MQVADHKRPSNEFGAFDFLANHFFIVEQHTNRVRVVTLGSVDALYASCVGGP